MTYSWVMALHAEMHSRMGVSARVGACICAQPYGAMTSGKTAPRMNFCAETYPAGFRLRALEHPQTRGVHSFEYSRVQYDIAVLSSMIEPSFGLQRSARPVRCAMLPRWQSSVDLWP